MQHQAPPPAPGASVPATEPATEPATSTAAENQSGAAVDATRNWIVKVVIGLNLCPFAKAPFNKGQIRYQLSAAVNEEQLLHDLRAELLLLAAADPQALETTLLIHPHVLSDFYDYNQFLDLADALLEELELDGELQIASFHPDYQFADSGAQDVENCTNRSPYPCLHLLREDSIERAVQAFPDAAEIYERNMETMRKLGWDGWQALCPGQSGAANIHKE